MGWMNFPTGTRLMLTDRLGALAMLLITIAVISCGVKTKPGSDAPTALRVGMELSYPPFEMVDPSGNPAGVSVELARALAESLGQPLHIESMEFTGLIESLRSGKIDCIISSLTASGERRKVIDFSDGYVTTGLCLLVNASKKDLKSIQDFDQSGHVIAVKQGTTGHIYAMQHFKSATVRVFEKEDTCVLEVVQGKSTAFIYDQMSVYRHWTRHRESTIALLEPFQKEQWAVGVDKSRPELLVAVNQFILSFRDKGGFDQLADQFLQEEKKAFMELGYPFIFQP
jgi:polar amino acid transport system substrate-binding protein